jgi:hypothetical protein
MRVTIEDLEALKELSEELEENHIETERAMLDEISTCHSTIGWTWLMPSCGVDEKDVLLAERQQRIEQLEEACQDTERTISRFRELVVQLERSVTSRFRYDGLNKVNGVVSSRLCVRSRRTRKMIRPWQHRKLLLSCH